MTFAERLFLPVYQNAMAQLHPLRLIFFELTHRCNLRCLHCGSDCVQDPSSEDLDAQKVIDVLRDIASRYNPKAIQVAFSGGEPLCYPGFFDLAGRVTAMGFSVGLVSNGYGWTTSTITAARQAGIRTLSISVDGLAEEHNWLRGRTDAFERTLKTLELLLSDPFYRAMDVITCVNRRNLERLDQLYALLQRLGIRQWRLFVTSPIGRAAGVPELILDGPALHRLLEKVIAYKAKGELTVNYSESGYLGALYERRVRNHDYWCIAGIHVAGIMVNGDILACPNIDRRFKQGHLDQDRFTDVWENGYQVFRNRRWMRTGACAQCSEWRQCRGNSFHLWDLDKNETRYCHYRMLSSRRR